jgi:uncharacterized membrane protein YphA (DoxX/SURF4 family)
VNFTLTHLTEKVFPAELGAYFDLAQFKVATIVHMKYIASLLVFALLPLLASAHTKWFADSELHKFTTTEPTTLYMGVWTAIIILIASIGIFLEKKRWFSFDALKPSEPHVFERAASTFVMVAGAFFLIAGTHEYLFSPNLTVESGVPMYLIVIQIAIGISLLLGVASRVSGIILGATWFTLFLYAGWIAALEDIWVLSTAIFITLMGNDYFSIISFSFLRKIVSPYKDYALPILRLGTGATLMVLGLSEKIMAPEFGINFLHQHHWNFMELLGFNFSDYLFTLSAGSVEFLFGLIFVLGVVTRLNALVVAVVFSIPLFILGPIELAGHLPHFAAVVMLLLFGSGNYFKLGKKQR